MNAPRSCSASSCVFLGPYKTQELTAQAPRWDLEASLHISSTKTLSSSGMFFIVHSVAKSYTWYNTFCDHLQLSPLPRLKTYHFHFFFISNCNDFMFKTKHDLGSPNRNLNTPKIPPMALPESPSRRPPRSSSRAE